MNKYIAYCGTCKNVQTCDKVGMIINNNEDALKNLQIN